MKMIILDIILELLSITMNIKKIQILEEVKEKLIAIIVLIIIYSNKNQINQTL